MNTTITTDRLWFRGRINRMGSRFVIYVPKALNDMVKKSSRNRVNSDFGGS